MADQHVLPLLSPGKASWGIRTSDHEPSPGCRCQPVPSLSLGFGDQLYVHRWDLPGRPESDAIRELVEA